MPQEIAVIVVEGIFCKLKEMGIWTGDAIPRRSVHPHRPHSARTSAVWPANIRASFVPEDCLGTHVHAGQVLGTVIDALEGVARQEVKAPCDGLVFSQRSYSAVYPGTLIAQDRRSGPGKRIFCSPSRLISGTI